MNINVKQQKLHTLAYSIKIRRKRSQAMTLTSAQQSNLQHISMTKLTKLKNMPSTSNPHYEHNFTELCPQACISLLILNV